MQKKGRKTRQNRHSPVSDSQDSRELLRSILHFMKQSQQLELSELISIYSDISPEEAIPISIFAGNLSPSESICKYLKEEQDLSFHNIALILNRDDRSIWTSYTRAKKKRPSRIKIAHRPENILVPLTIFHDRTLSILESVVHHLKTEHHMSNPKIASLLGKNSSAIATVAKRAGTKRDEVKKGA